MNTSKHLLLYILSLFYVLSSSSLWAEEKRVIEEDDFEGKGFEEAVDFRGIVFRPKERHWYYRDWLFLDSTKGSVYAKTSFSFANFSEIADFRKSQFSKVADFHNSSFNTVIFYQTKFSDTANFSYAHFSDTTIFNEATFLEKVDFSKTQFSNISSFRKANFSDTANFRYANFSNTTIFNEATFLGKVDFSETQFLKTADFSNTRFSDAVNFSKNVLFGEIERTTVFLNIVIFRGAHFEKQADFSLINFPEEADFTNTNFSNTTLYFYTNFLKKVNFRDVHFEKQADFRNANFSGKADFSSAVFLETGDFNEANFLEKTDFIGAEFSDAAHFNYTQFSDTTNFRSANFSGKAFFLRAIFLEKTNFRESKFSKKADFTATQFLKEADFIRSTLPDTLIFYATKLVKEINLSTCILDSAKAALGRKCKIDLRNAPIEKFNFTYDNFQILKPDSVPSKSHFQALDIVYQKLLKNFKERGYITSYESLDKEYKAFLFTQNPYHSTFSHGLNIVLNWINRIWHDYGYAKWYIFIHIGIFLSFFSLYNWFRFPQLLKAYKIQRIVDALPKSFDRDKKFNYKQFALSFFYTCLIFFGLKMETSEFNFKKKRAVLYLFFQYIVGLVCLAYFTNFVISSNLIGG